MGVCSISSASPPFFFVTFVPSVAKSPFGFLLRPLALFRGHFSSVTRING